jgi:DNA polymerase-1
MSINYGFGHKIDNIKLNYWDKGIDTDKIPPDELEEYGIQDIELSYQVFLKQLEKFQGPEQDKFLLFRVQCNDLLVLEEIEWNGIYYDKQGSLEAAEKLNKQIETIDKTLTQLFSGIPINWNSRDDISCVLYGGDIGYKVKVPIGIFKSGLRIGEVKTKIIEQHYTLPRRVEPIKGSELKKEGFYSTDAETLASLKPDKEGRFIVSKLLERAKIKKLQSTYLTGFPKIIEELEWENNIIHSNLNQCSVVTGRLSSTKPNQQNLPKEAKRYCVSRYSTK